VVPHARAGVRCGAEATPPASRRKWHLDGVRLKSNGRKHWLRRAVDQEGMGLDILVQSRRNREAAETFLRQVLAVCGNPPRVNVTDKLARYPPALRRVLPGAEHRRQKGLNNWAEMAWSQPTSCA
jgi:putative transposase